MSDYQEAKKSTVAPAAKTAPSGQSSAQKKEKNKESSVSLCPSCSASIPEGAVFCPECGFNLETTFCPNCGEATTPGGDICEKCKTWLLDGQCKFCYANLDPNAAFCAECGNPKDGIQCPDCGNLSIFDFCNKCGKPLTEGALLAIELANNDPDAKALVDAVRDNVDIQKELAELDMLLNRAPPSPDIDVTPSVKKSLFSNNQLSAIMKSGGNRDGQVQRREEAEKKAEDLARKQEEEKRLKEIREAKARKEALERDKEKAEIAAKEAQEVFKRKTFPTHQDARRFHYATKPQFPPPVGWCCNFKDIIHFDGPDGCDMPSKGGYWYYGDYHIINITGPC